jgi:hypothetical protein
MQLWQSVWSQALLPPPELEEELVDALEAELLDVELLDVELLDVELLDVELLDVELLDVELLDVELLDVELLDEAALDEAVDALEAEDDELVAPLELVEDAVCEVPLDSPPLPELPCVWPAMLPVQATTATRRRPTPARACPSFAATSRIVTALGFGVNVLTV